MRDPIKDPIKVTIDAGHGGRDSGATYGRLLEKGIVLEIALVLSEMLDAAGFYAMMTRRGDYFMYNPQRARMANSSEADIFVSIHCNADPDEDHPDMPEAKGSEIWIYPGSKKGMRLATSIMNHIEDEFPGRKFRGIKEAKFTVLKRTKMPSVLCEVGFIDTEESLERFEDDAVLYKIAKVLYSGVKDYSCRWLEI